MRGDRVRDLASRVDVERGCISDHAPEEGDVERVTLAGQLQNNLRFDGVLACLEPAGEQLGDRIHLPRREEEGVLRDVALLLLKAEAV